MNKLPVIRGINYKSIEKILLQGLRVVEKIDDRAFTKGGRNSIGIHFRHWLDFATIFKTA